MERLRFASDREESATRFLTQKAVPVTLVTSDSAGVLAIQGTVKHASKTYTPSLTVDADERII